MGFVERIRPRIRYADLENEPEDGPRYEIYDGEVFVVPAPRPLHQVVVQKLFEVLRDHAARHGGLVLFSPIDVVFSEFDALQPDLLYFTEARRRLVDLRQAIRSDPDLVIEVLSPSTAATDRGRKMQTYARFGVGEYWLVDPEGRTIEVLRFSGGAYALTQTARVREELISATISGLSFETDRAFDI